MSPEQITAYLAEREAEITAQQMLVDRLDQLLDDEQRELRDREAQLVNLRALLKERGDLR